MRKATGASGAIALSIGHVAGMIDMIALPLWVGSLIKYYHYSPAHAGFVVTVFLFSVVVASVLIAPVFRLIAHRIGVAVGFSVAAAAFLFISRQPIDGAGFAAMASLHAIAGLGVGCALSITHGNIGRSANPHRLFGMVNVALGVMGVFTFAGLPPLIAAFGPRAMFIAFAAIMLTASLVCAVAFPSTAKSTEPAGTKAERLPVPASAWLVIFGIMCMTFNQAMVFSFLTQLGLAHGFGEGHVNAVLVAVGFINLVPGALAAILQTRLSAVAIAIAGPIIQAALALILSNTTGFAAYAMAGSVFAAALIFTHVFLFGLLSRIDTSGRCVAATPAMTMIGSCAGPAVGGLIVSSFGYHGLGWMVALTSLIAVGLFTLLRQREKTQPVLQMAANG